MSAVVGLNCKTYRNTGTWGTPVWALLTTIKDDSITLDKGSADASSRVSTWRQFLPTLKDGELTITFIYDTGNTDFVALRTAYLTDSLMGFAVADGPIATTGTSYWKFEGYVLSFSESEPLEDVKTVEVKVKPGYSSNVPTNTTV